MYTLCTCIYIYYTVGEHNNKHMSSLNMSVICKDVKFKAIVRGVVGLDCLILLLSQHIQTGIKFK